VKTFSSIIWKNKHSLGEVLDDLAYLDFVFFNITNYVADLVTGVCKMFSKHGNRHVFAAGTIRSSYCTFYVVSMLMVLYLENTKNYRQIASIVHFTTAKLIVANTQC